jgi:uncharacterized Zn-finger protein
MASYFAAAFRANQSEQEYGYNELKRRLGQAPSTIFGQVDGIDERRDCVCGSASPTTRQNAQQTTALAISMGTMLLPVNAPMAAGPSDEKRKRNADASARFRQRREARLKRNADAAARARQRRDAKLKSWSTGVSQHNSHVEGAPADSETTVPSFGDWCASITQNGTILTPDSAHDEQSFATPGYGRGRTSQRDGHAHSSSQPLAGSRASSTSSVRSMIDERLEWAHQDRVRSASRDRLLPPSPFQEYSPFFAEYARNPVPDYWDDEMHTECLPPQAPLHPHPTPIVQVHVRDSHADVWDPEDRHTCDVCGKTFVRLSSLRVHHLTHEGGESLVCSHSDCGERFAVLSDLKRHERCHVRSPSPSRATIIESRETRPTPPTDGLREEEVLRAYPVQAEDPATLCVPRDHTHHVATAVEKCKSDPPRLFPPPWYPPAPPAILSRSTSSFTCPVCQQTFTRRTGLVNHQRTHTGEKPYTCKIAGCDQTFKQQGDKTRHEEAQHGEKTFICGDSTWGCGKAFGRKDGLLEHHRKTTKGKKCLEERDRMNDSQGIGVNSFPIVG